jgi:hypothetical protein
MIGIFCYTIPYPRYLDKVTRRAFEVEKVAEEPGNILPPEEPGIWSEVLMPRGSKLLRVDTGHTTLAFWAAVPIGETRLCTRKFLLLMGGEAIDDEKFPTLLYRGTVQIYYGGFLWHVFEPMDQVLAEDNAIATIRVEKTT